MTFHDHKTFWLFIAVMIGGPSILFVLALLKATTKDPFGGVTVKNHRPLCAGRDEPPIQFSAVPVLDKARGSTADIKAHPSSRKSASSVRFNGILAAAEPQAVSSAYAHADRLSDFQLEWILTKV